MVAITKARLSKIIANKQDVTKVTDMTKMFAVSDFVQNITKWYGISNTSLHNGLGNGMMKKENSPAKLFDIKGKI